MTNQNYNHDSRICMGQLLLAGGFLKPEQLKAALALRECSQREARLGEILEQQELLDHTETTALLHLQDHLQEHLTELSIDNRHGEKLPAELQLSLGQLLLDNEQITAQQLQDALAAHKRSHKHLGETLVEQQLLTEQALQGWLGLQQKLMAAATAAIFLIGFASPVTAAELQYERPFASEVAAMAGQLASTGDFGDGWGDRRMLDKAIDSKHIPLGEIHLDEDGDARLSLTKEGVQFSRKF